MYKLVIFFLSLFFSLKQILITGMYYVLTTTLSSCLMICCYKKYKGGITIWFNRIMQADGDNTDVETHPPPTSLFVDTSINGPSAANLMVESDQEEGDEEDLYSNIGLPPTTMAPTVPIVHQPVTVSNPRPPPQRSSSVVMLSDDEQETDEEQGGNQCMQPVALQVSTSVKKKSTDPSADNTPAPIPSSVIAHSSQEDTITPVPSSSNEPQLPQQVTKPQKVKKTLTDISRRFSARILNKQKSGNNKEQETVKGKQKKKEL